MSNFVSSAALMTEKELLTFNYPETDVLYSRFDQEKRLAELKKAEFLGQNFRKQSVIEFEGEHGVFYMKDTIWTITDRFVKLKKGGLIPIARIKKIY